MGRHVDWYDEEEPLVREAVVSLVDAHYEEYRSLVKGALQTRIEELETELRDKEETIKLCRRHLAKAAEDKERWRQRVASGRTELQS